MKTTVIGVDGATDSRKPGLARASVQENRTEVLEATGGETQSPASIIYEWIGDSQQVLLALDAPLGWPAWA